MRFLGCVLLITCTVFPMEHLAQKSNIRKFTCHTDKFGYVFKRKSESIPGLEYIYLCDYEQTKACSDETRCYINNRLFKRLMIELSHNDYPLAKESFICLIDRLRTGRITMDQKCAHVSHKDLCHRIFSHISALKDKDDDTHLVLNNYLVRPYFQLPSRSTCVHQFTTIMYEYESDMEHVLFGQQLDKEFEALKPFPSLVALAAQVIRKKRKREELPILPQELESLLH